MDEGPRPVAVFDCNVFAQALISQRGPAGALIAAVRQGTVRLVISDHVLREIGELPSKLHARLRVTDARVQSLLVDLLRFALQVPAPPPVFAHARDPDDAGYVDLAVAAGAGYLVTRDDDLLALSADTPDGRAFAARFPGLRVVDPVVFLQLLAGREGQP